MGTDTAELPSYDDALRNTATELVRPSVLVLSGQSIHAEADPSKPLYRLNRGVAYLGDAASKVEFERIENNPHRTDSGAVYMRQRPRHIYNLRHGRPHLGASHPSSDNAKFFLQSVFKNGTYGNMGFKPGRLHSSRRYVLRINMANFGELDMPPFSKTATAPLFQVDHQKGTYRWTDCSGGKSVAVEYKEDHQHRLIVTEPLPRPSLDALVALWCCQIWMRSVEREFGLVT